MKEGDLAFAYAGIHGHAQGLEVILRAAELLKDRSEVKFIFLGSGPEKDKLLEMKREMGLNNVQFLDVIGKKDMPYFVSAIDVSVIPLKDIPLFEGAIPSKIFENLAMKKAILLGVKGEAKELFIEEGRAGLFFIPENERSLKEAIESMLEDRSALKLMGENGRAFVEKRFNRDVIAEGFMNELSTIKK